MIVRPHDFITDALSNHYALGAFNTSNLELTQAIVLGAKQMKSPVIVQTSEGAIEYGGINVLSAIVKTLAAEESIPVILHLDHGHSLDLIKQCIQAGYTSVMIDLSTRSLSENISLTKKVVAFAHPHRVWVEAELGSILGAEGAKELGRSSVPDSSLTDPRQVKQFVMETGINSLAVSVGTIHGAFTGQEYIRFELLSKIEQCVPDFPLVIHGASGIPDAHLHQVSTANVCKINVDTELRIAFEQAVRAYVLQEHDSVDPRKILGPARDAVQRVVANKIKVFGSASRIRSSPS